MSAGAEPVRVTLVTQWFPPEPAYQPLWIAQSLREQGLRVEVLTGIPNYPSGIVADGYSAQDRLTEKVDGFTVHRTPLYASHDTSAARRMANYLSWAASATAFGAGRLRRSHVALVYSSPATSALPAVVARWLFRIRYVLLIQDVWPDSVFDSGLVHGRRGLGARLGLRVLTTLVASTYRNADHIVVISPGMVDLLVSRGVPRDKLSLVYNWVRGPAREISPRTRTGGDEAEDLVLMYAGNHGSAQALEHLIHGVAAVAADVRCRLVLVGDGVEKAGLVELASTVAPERVTFVEPQPREAMNALMDRADVQVVSLIDRPLFDVTMPSKLQSAMAAGHPVLAVAGRDVRDVVQKARCGVGVPSGDSQALTAAITRLYEAGRDSLADMGARGRDYYDAHMAEEVGATRLAGILRNTSRHSSPCEPPRPAGRAHQTINSGRGLRKELNGARRMDIKRIALIPALRKVALPVLARVNPGDVKITNPYSKDRLKLHSFRHRGYWFHGRRREEATMALFARLVAPGQTVYEVGGHIGFIAQYFSSLVGPTGSVVVFEPGPNNLPYLRENVGRLTNVKVIESAVGAEPGEATLHVEQLTGQNNSLVADFGGLVANERSAGVAAHVSQVAVPVVDLDSFAGDTVVDFVKIDVEGFELEVLQGAEQLLTRHRPILMVEVQRNYEEVAALAERQGYRRFDEHLQPVGVHFTGNTFWLHEEAHADLRNDVGRKAGS